MLLLMILGVLAIVWLLVIAVVIGLCASAGRTDRVMTPVVSRPSRTRPRLIA